MTIESLYLSYRPMLFSLAYRMLGSVMDAEDIVQEAFITFDQLPNAEQIENQKAYLSKIVTNRCLDLLRSAAKQRELYIGPWLPEPLIDAENTIEDPTQSFLQQESVTTAYLLLLQQLKANERAVFLLREVFQYSYDEIAEILNKSSANCRQIFHRAKQSIHYDPDQQPSISLAKSTINDFLQSMLKGNVDRLLELVSEDVIFYSDGGGKVQAARVPVFGATRVIQLQLNLVKMYEGQFEYTLKMVNGQPGLIIKMKNGQKYVYSFAFHGKQIQTIYTVANPDKLRHLKY